MKITGSLSIHMALYLICLTILTLTLRPIKAQTNYRPETDPSPSSNHDLWNSSVALSKEEQLAAKLHNALKYYEEFKRVVKDPQARAMIKLLLSPTVNPSEACIQSLELLLSKLNNLTETLANHGMTGFASERIWPLQSKSSVIAL